LGSSSFVHCHVHTEYSILDGAARIGELFEAAARMEMPAIAVTDHGNMYAALDFYQAGRKWGVKPIIGSELYVATRSRFEKSSREKDSSRHLTVLAQDDRGYRNLMRLVTAGHLDGFFYRPRIDKEILAQHAEGLIGFSGCLASEVNEHLKIGAFDEALKVAAEYRDIFGADNYFIELQDHGLADQRKVLGDLLEISRKLGVRTVATNDLHYTKRDDASAHDVLLCIQTNAKINEAGRFKFDAEEFYLKSAEEMRAVFADHPDACDATLEIAERCNISIEFGQLHLPPYTPPTGETQESYLRRLVAEGARERYGEPLTQEAHDRISHELKIIIDMGFAGYFLIVADLIAFARSRGIRVGPGRGSAAGSVVSYSLRITDLDPIRYGLIFERFLNPERRQMPDIDMDFDERRRGEMIRYATERYGEDRVAQIITFGTIKGKQALRDASRVMDLPYTFGDRLAKMYPPPILGKEAPLKACFEKSFSWPDPGRNDAYPNAGDLRKAYQEDEIATRVIDIARQLEGLRRQVSVHAAGVVIGDRPLVEYLPLKRAEEAGGGGIVTQYEMHGVEELGLLKMDFLGLRNLTVINEAVINVERTRGLTLDVDNLPLDDRRSYRMLSEGDTIGVFQLESGGMRDLVKRLRPDRFEDIMALVALYRPGPLGEKMHIEYAERKHGNRQVEYPHADLKPILEETFGIILYQEQALRIAVDMAGFTMGEADTLRKAMGKKIPEVMRAQREKFVNGTTGKGYTQVLAEKLWDLIDHFSGYGFNKSHSCGYAFIAYQTAWLKSGYPVEYFAALLTSVKGNTDKTAMYIAECRDLKITVLPPDVNASEADFTPLLAEGSEGKIRFGLSAIRNVGENVVAAIIRERTERGPFTSFADFCHRVEPAALNKRLVEAFVKAGAFDSLGVNRAAMLDWGTDKRSGLPMLVLAESAGRMLDAASDYRRNEDLGQSSLFGAEEHHALVDPAPSGADIQRSALLTAEKEMLGFYVSEHPLLEQEAAIRASTDATISALATLPEGTVRTVGGIVSRSQRKFTKKGDAMGILVLEDLSGAIEVVVFPNTFSQLPPEVVSQDAIVCVKGKVDTREDPAKFVALEIWRPNLEAGGDPLVLRLPAESCTPALVESLKGILQSHPGPTPVHLHLASGLDTTVLRLPNDFRIERRAGLYAELKSVLGQSALPAPRPESVKVGR
jgi:DNA polymerase III subunit alpha